MKRLRESGEVSPCPRIAGGRCHEYANPPQLVWLLRTHHQRPWSRSASEQGDETPSPHGPIPRRARQLTIRHPPDSESVGPDPPSLAASRQQNSIIRSPPTG